MENKDKIEIPFGAKDSELCECEYTIPDGYEAEIKDDKVIIRKKEFEDERLCKQLIAFLKQCKGVYGDGFKQFGLDIDDAIAWLEKQGEHANFRNKIRVGDKVTRNEDGVLVNLSQLNRVAKKDEKQGEQKLYVNDNAKEMFIKALECVEEQNNKGYKLTDCDKNSWWEDFKAYTSCTVEQKPAWSEEDEEISEAIIKRIKGESEALSVSLSSAISWVGNIKDRVQLQSQWKPSKEQMVALDGICSYIRNKADWEISQDTIHQLYSLSEQLKKLKS